MAFFFFELSFPLSPFSSSFSTFYVCFDSSHCISLVTVYDVKKKSPACHLSMSPGRNSIIQRGISFKQKKTNKKHIWKEKKSTTKKKTENDEFWKKKTNKNESINPILKNAKRFSIYFNFSCGGFSESRVVEASRNLCKWVLGNRPAF